MKTTLQSLKTTLSAAVLAVLCATNLAGLPTAAVSSSASLGSAALSIVAQAAPWLGLGAGLVVSGEAMATAKAIPGIGIRVRKNPGGNNRTAPVNTGPDGSFSFTGLEPGDYEVTPDGGKSVMMKVGADGKLNGVVQAKPGTANDWVITMPTKIQATDSSYVPQKADGSGGAEKGIKDNGTKSCGNCGLTGGKVAAPTPGAATESTHAKHKDEIAAPAANARNGGVKGTCATGRDDKGNCKD
jgi:hypothetical protein